jgi:uncharacterized protein YbbC (DUF1343 family)
MRSTKLATKKIHTQIHTQIPGGSELKTGIDILRERDFAPLRGRRVGLLSHRAAIAADGRGTAEILHEAVNLVALFGPEHGFQGRALAGEATPSFEHPDWRIPVHSLYGATREPSPEMLAGVDCVVCDLQDLGVRCYTYLATLRNMMRACERAGVEVVVLDRPVPLPRCVDGPVREAALDSFVAPPPRAVRLRHDAGGGRALDARELAARRGARHGADGRRLPR